MLTSVLIWVWDYYYFYLHYYYNICQASIYIEICSPYFTSVVFYYDITERFNNVSEIVGSKQNTWSLSGTPIYNTFWSFQEKLEEYEKHYLAWVNDGDWERECSLYSPSYPFLSSHLLPYFIYINLVGIYCTLYLMARTLTIPSHTQISCNVQYTQLNSFNNQNVWVYLWSGQSQAFYCCACQPKL